MLFTIKIFMIYAYEATCINIMQTFQPKNCFLQPPFADSLLYFVTYDSICQYVLSTTTHTEYCAFFNRPIQIMFARKRKNDNETKSQIK